MANYHTFRDWPKRTFSSKGTGKGTQKGPKPNSGGIVIADPTDIPGIALWLDGADVSSMRQVAGAQPFGEGSTAVTISGQHVACWMDKSGNNYHMNNSGGDSFEPTYVTGVKNGLSALSGDGTDDLIATSSVLTQDQELFIVSVGAVYSDETRGIVFANSNVSNNVLLQQIDARTANRDGTIVADTTGVARAVYPSDIGTAARVFTSLISGGFVTSRVDGVAGTPVPYAGDGVTANDYTRIFSQQSGLNKLTGYLGEVIVVDMAAAPASTYSNAAKILKWVKAAEVWAQNKWATPAIP